MTSDAVTPRRENVKERDTIRLVNEAAFGRSDEADLVDRLRVEGAVLASFVAELNDQIVGHILFSRILIDATSGPISAVALAPDHAAEVLRSERILVHQRAEWAGQAGMTDERRCHNS